MDDRSRRRTGATPDVTRRTFAAALFGAALAGCAPRPESASLTDALPTSTGRTAAVLPPGAGRHSLRPSVSLPEGLPSPERLLIQGAQVFDGIDLVGRTDVYLEGGRIRGTGVLSPSPGIPVLDATGLTLLPGLIDSHVEAHQPRQGTAHLEQPSLVFGVTTEMDLYSPPDPDRAGALADTGLPEQSDIITAGHLATVPGGHPEVDRPGQLALPRLEGADQADAWVQSRREEGSEFLTIVIDSRADLRTLEAETAGALVEAARRRGLLTVAHVGTLADADLAVSARVDGLAHLPAAETLPEALLHSMVQRNVFLVSTLGRHFRPAAKPVLQDRVVDVLSATARARLSSSEVADQDGDGGDDRRAALLAAHARGVPLVLGTDHPGPGTVGGLGLVVEMELLVAGGMAPVDALRAAAAVPGRVWGLADRARIQPGLLADVVLVEGDPTQDITAMRRVVRTYRLGHPTEGPAA